MPQQSLPGPLECQPSSHAERKSNVAHGPRTQSQNQPTKTYLKIGLYAVGREAEFMYSEPAGGVALLLLGIRQGCDGILCSNAVAA